MNDIIQQNQIVAQIGFVVLVTEIFRQNQCFGATFLRTPIIFRLNVFGHVELDFFQLLDFPLMNRVDDIRDNSDDNQHDDNAYCNFYVEQAFALAFGVAVNFVDENRRRRVTFQILRLSRQQNIFQHVDRNLRIIRRALNDLVNFLRVNVLPQTLRIQQNYIRVFEFLHFGNERSEKIFLAQVSVQIVAFLVAVKRSFVALLNQIIRQRHIRRRR